MLDQLLSPMSEYFNIPVFYLKIVLITMSATLSVIMSMVYLGVPRLPIPMKYTLISQHQKMIEDSERSIEVRIREEEER
jgi:hypothetical protein